MWYQPSDNLDHQTLGKLVTSLQGENYTVTSLETSKHHILIIFCLLKMRKYVYNIL